MEKSGFERSLKYRKDCGVKIDCITTDRHISISSFMDRESGIKHQYDVWHFAKSIVKKLHHKSRQKNTKGSGLGFGPYQTIFGGVLLHAMVIQTY